MSCCESGILSIQVPGPPGLPGAPGTNGVDGVNAYSTTTGAFTMPTYLANVIDVPVPSTWMQIDQVIFGSGGAFSGYFQVVSKSDSSHATLKNLDDNAGAYPDNSPPTSVFPSGTKFSPGGVQGPSGPAVPGGTYFAIANNLNEGTPATMRTNLGLGSAALFTQGVANGNIPNIQDAGGIGANEVVVGTGLGIQGLTAAQTRTLLSLGTAALVDTGVADTKIPTVNDGAGLTNGESIWATATGIESVTAATARSRLGVTAQAMLLFNQQETVSDAGSFTTGDWRTVPLNTEVVDTGGNGSIAANQITLAAGDYRYEYGVVGYEVDGFQGRLYNFSDSAPIAKSYSTVMIAAAGSGIPVVSIGAGRFTIGGSKTIELQAQCTTSQATDGFGRHIGTAFTDFVTEVYSYILLWKE